MTNSAMPQLMSDFFLFLEQNVSCVSMPAVVMTQISWSRVKAMRSRSAPPSFGSHLAPADPAPLSRLEAVESERDALGEVRGPETDTKLRLAVRADCIILE